MPYYNRDPKRHHNFDNHPHSTRSSRSGKEPLDIDGNLLDQLFGGWFGPVAPLLLLGFSSWGGGGGKMEWKMVVTEGYIAALVGIHAFLHSRLITCKLRGCSAKELGVSAVMCP